MSFDKPPIWKAWDLLQRKDKQYFTTYEEGWLVPYIHRLRGREKHLPYISLINRMVFGVPLKVLHSILLFTIEPDPFVSSPKATKYDEKKLELLKPYVKHLYGWSEKEFQNNKKEVTELLNNKEFIMEVNQHVSFEKNEAKALGVDYVKYKPKPKKDTNQTTLF